MRTGLDSNDVLETRECLECFAPFQITIGESEYLRDTLGFNELPKRCKQCRRLKRVTKRQQLRFDVHREVRE